MATIKGIESAASRFGSLTPTSLLLIGAAVSALLHILYLQMLPKPLPGIPYHKDSARRILGDIPRLEALRHAGDTTRKFWPSVTTDLKSPVAQVFLGPFNKAAVVLSDFREAQDIQLRNPKALVRGWMNNQLWQGLIPEHFIAMEDHDVRFKDTKSLGKDLMTPRFLNEVNAPASHVQVNNFIALWQEKMRIAQGRPFDAMRDLSNLTYDIILSAALGFDSGDMPASTQQLNHLLSGQDSLAPPNDPDSLFPFPEVEKPELLQAMDKIAISAATAASTPSPRLFHLINNLTPSMKKALGGKRSIIQGYVGRVSRRLVEEGESFQPRAAVDHFVSREAAMAERAGREALFDTPRMNDAIFGYLTGGQDSTHSTLSFLVKHLGAHQEIQEKLRQALFQAYPNARANGQQPELDSVLKTKIPYLDAFIEEVLRVSNPSIVISKEANEELTILGHVIPKGTMVLITSAGPTFNYAGPHVDESLRSESSQKHRDEGLGDWADSAFPPEEFHPERWLKPSENGFGELVFDPKAGPLLTFSSGPRMCWGKRLAYLELKLVVTLFLWNFVFDKLPDHLHDWDMVDDLFIKPKHSRVRLSSVPPPKKSL